MSFIAYLPVLFIVECLFAPTVPVPIKLFFQPLSSDAPIFLFTSAHFYSIYRTGQAALPVPAALELFPTLQSLTPLPLATLMRRGSFGSEARAASDVLMISTGCATQQTGCN
jgi:hypothetical protein